MPLNKDKAHRWADFILTYWTLLDKDQRDAYALDLIEGKSPPTITLDDLTEIEHTALRQHQGEVIQKYRKKSKMSSEQLAVLLGKQKTYISLIESGQRSLTVVDMYRIMKTLDIPSTEMFKMTAHLPKEAKPAKAS